MVTRRIVCKLKKMIDIFSISTNELVIKMRSGDISSVEVCKAYLERVKKYEKDVKAW